MKRTHDLAAEIFAARAGLLKTDLTAVSDPLHIQQMKEMADGAYIDATVFITRAKKISPDDSLDYAKFLTFIASIAIGLTLGVSATRLSAQMPIIDTLIGIIAITGLFAIGAEVVRWILRKCFRVAGKRKEGEGA